MNIFPKISIITPSYNQGKYLERTILSVIQQNYPNLEYIIIDGGSTDNSVEIIRKYESKITYWVSEKDSGQSHAINKGFQKITGDIVGWINSDDWYEDGVFDEIVKNFRMNPSGIWLGNCIKHFENGKKSRVLKPSVPTFQSLTRYWRSNFCPPQPSIFFPHSCLKTTGYLDESLNYAMDLDLWIRMAHHFNFYYVNKTLSNYLVHDMSKTGSSNAVNNFRKEWKMVCFRYLRKASFREKIPGYLDYVIHPLLTPFRFLAKTGNRIMKQIIKNVIPGSIKRRVYHLALVWVRRNNSIRSAQIPKHNLEKKHIENSRLLTNRKNLLELLPKHAVVAELGVDEGNFSAAILNICTPKKLHLIDLWGSERYNQSKRKGVENKFKQEIDNGIVEINLGLSTEVVNDFQDNYFDWIYIDTSHSYKVTIQELEAYRLKVKDNGIIAGHDYIIGNWNSVIRYGVIEAVSVFCLKYDWEIIYLTVELDNNPSFAIKKINTAAIKK